LIPDEAELIRIINILGFSNPPAIEASLFTFNNCGLDGLLGSAETTPGILD
jgi:hypothetical protein